MFLLQGNSTEHKKEEYEEQEYKETTVLENRKSKLKERKKGYSSFSCIGPLDSADDYLRRVCKFENICYSDNKFIYYSKEESPIIFDKNRGILFGFSETGKPFVQVQFRRYFVPPNTFTPEIKYEKIPLSFKMKTGQSFMWQHWDTNFNFGHLVWEEIGSIYFTQRRFHDVDRDVQVIEFDDSYKKNAVFERLINLSLPAISNHKLTSLKKISQNKPICFEKLFVGGSLNLFRDSEVEVNGWEPVLYEYRNLMLHKFNIVPQLPQDRPHIIIVNKTVSDSKKRDLRRIVNSDEVFQFLRLTYPDAIVKTIVWHKYTIASQLRIISSTSIVITPCGGVSMILPFLPEGAHAIVMDFPTLDGKTSVQMDSPFWNRFPHIKKMYYQVFDKSDYIVHEGTNIELRQDTSVIIKTERLQFLVDSALQDMGYIE